MCSQHHTLNPTALAILNIASLPRWPHKRGEMLPLFLPSPFSIQISSRSTQFPVPTWEWMNRVQRNDLEGNAKTRHREDNTMDRHGDRHPPPGLLCGACVFFCKMQKKIIRKPISCRFPCFCWHQRASGSVWLTLLSVVGDSFSFSACWSFLFRSWNMSWWRFLVCMIFWSKHKGPQVSKLRSPGTQPELHH